MKLRTRASLLCLALTAIFTLPSFAEDTRMSGFKGASGAKILRQPVYTTYALGKWDHTPFKFNNKLDWVRFDLS